MKDHSLSAYVFHNWHHQSQATDGHVDLHTGEVSQQSSTFVSDEDWACTDKSINLWVYVIFTASQAKTLC